MESCISCHAGRAPAGEHFDRWLALFETTTREIFEGYVAEAFIIRAHSIAGNSETGIATTRGRIARPGAWGVIGAAG